MTEAEHPGPLIELKDNSQRAKTAITVFSILIGFTLIGIASGYLELDLLWRARAGDNISEAEANTNDLRQGIIGIIQFGIFITAAIVFLNWFRRAYGNLHRLGLNLRYSETMAVWSFIIPIVSLYMPYQIMSEIWKSNLQKIKQFNPDYVPKWSFVLVGIWWTLFVISNIIGQYIFRTIFNDDTLEDFIAGSKATLIRDIMDLPGAFLVILIVQGIAAMEAKLSEELKRSGANIVYK